MSGETTLLSIIVEELPPVMGALSSIAAGVWAVFDDISDFGKLPDEDHPGPHHWMWGVVFIVLGGVTLFLIVIRLMIKLGWLKLRPFSSI